MELVLDAAAQHQTRQQRLTRLAVLGARKLWTSLGYGDFDTAFLRIGPQLIDLLSTIQLASAMEAHAYIDAALIEQKIKSKPVAELVPTALAGVSSWGNNLSSLLYSPIIRVRASLADGMAMPDALAAGGDLMEAITATQITDTGRSAESVAMAVRPRVQSFVRHLKGTSCSRCVLLAGVVYHTSVPFKRHPQCDCIQIPSEENVSGDQATDMNAHFQSLSKEEQDRIFTKSGAEAIRLGADIPKVVNARDGALGLRYAGPVLTEMEKRHLALGYRRRGVREQVVGTGPDKGRSLVITKKPYVSTARKVVKNDARWMPESILDVAGNDRDLARKLLADNGYIK